MYIVYKTTNITNGKYYIGVHCNEKLGYLGSGVAIKRAIKKHGRESFVRTTLFRCELMEDAYLMEKELIGELFKTDPRCYNMCCGGKIALAKRLNESDVKERLVNHAKNNSALVKERQKTDIVLRDKIINNLDIARRSYHQLLITEPERMAKLKNRMTGDSAPSKGSKWFNNGTKNRIFQKHEQVPPEFIVGRLPWKRTSQLGDRLL